MAHVLLLHSVLGLRPGVLGLARRLTEAGHPTLAPDLYGGRTTSDVQEGFRIHEELGWHEMFRRAREAAQGLPEDAVLAGISMGGGTAGYLWAERPHAAGVLFLCGPGVWPDEHFVNTPVELHMARPDPWDSEEFVAGWIKEAYVRPLTVHRYDGIGHNFLDEGGRDFDAATAAACEARVLRFLNGL